MSQATHVYRNTWNGRLGEMTEEQAAIWPDLLERVEADPAPQPEIRDEGHAPAEIPELVEPKALPSARSIKKD